MALVFKRHIIKNKPYEEANGQYNYGRIENEPRHLLGVPPDINYGGEEIELYTVIEHKDVDWSRYPEGIAWNFYGSELRITELGIQGRDRETDKDRYYAHNVMVYLFDSDRTGLIPDTGNEIRTLIGDGNAFSNNSHTIHGKDFGTYNFPHSCDPSGWGGDECRRQFVGDEFPEENMIIYDWPIEGHSKTNSTFSTAAVFNTDIQYWSKAITGKIDNSYLYFIVRSSGDESEYSPVGHGWLGLSGGYKSDELNRRYDVFTISKDKFYDVFINGTETIFGHGGSSPKDVNISRVTYDDDHDGGGHWGMHDSAGAAYTCDDIRIRAIPPIWTPAKALLQNYKWAKKDSFGQLHPKYELDYTGFPSVFYSDSEKFWDSSLITDFRPLSKVRSIIDTNDEHTDLQNYYEKGTPYSSNSSAPMTVNLSFDLVKNINSFNPKEFSENIEDNDFGIHYGWFVVNWDWNENWEGGETLEEIAETDFPPTAAGILTRQFQHNTYKLKTQGDTSIDESEIQTEFDVLKNEAVHTYTESGVKIVKVIFLTYIESHHSGEDLQGTQYAGNYIQALQWKMATVKINLATDRAYANDFSDIGGADYTYLPYPDVRLYDYPVGGIQYDENSGLQLWCENGINAPENVSTQSFINCEIETTAHPVVSGLSLESTYVQTLKGLLQTDAWGSSEGGDRLLGEKSYDNTPLQAVDEMGDYLGQSDIATVRYFERPFNMHEFLDLNMIFKDKDTPVNNTYCSHIVRGVDLEPVDGITEIYEIDDLPGYPYPGPGDCGQLWGTTYNAEGNVQLGYPTDPETLEGYSYSIAIGGQGDIQARGETIAVCQDGSQVILAYGASSPNDVDNEYRLLDGTYLRAGDSTTEPYQSVQGVNGEWACAQQMGIPYNNLLDTYFNFPPSDLPEPSEPGQYLHSYTDIDYWDGETNKFPTESSATDIFISEYPILHDKCLVELNFDTYDAVTIRDTSGNGCKAVAFGDYSIKKDKKNQPTQRDSSIDTPKIGTSNDEKAY